jgi:L-lactate dehydrogenase complex protein LldF
MDDHGQFSTVKKAAMKVAGKLLSRPRAYRAATEGGALALKVLPHFALYNQLNAWGRRRDVPEAPKETFHQWYARTRGRVGAAGPADGAGPDEVGHVGA